MEEVHAGHRQRLRDRIAQEGLEEAKTHEVLEYLLFYCLPRRDVNALAHALADRFETVTAVLSASVEELMSVEGIGRRTAEWFCALGELTAAYLDMEAEDRPGMPNMRQARAYIEEHMSDLPYGDILQITLSPEGRPVLYTPIGKRNGRADEGTLARAVKDVLAAHGYGALLVCRCEEDAPAPTAYDLEQALAYKRQLLDAGTLLLDFILVGHNAFYSMQAHGDLDAVGVDFASAGVLAERYARNASAEGRMLPRAEKRKP